MDFVFAILNSFFIAPHKCRCLLIKLRKLAIILRHTYTYNAILVLRKNKVHGLNCVKNKIDFRSF